MSHLQTDLTTLDQLLIEKLKISTQINAMQALILQAIRNGESSGDKIKDFLRVIGDWNCQYEKTVSDLDGRLQGQSGQPILALEITHNHDHQSDDSIELGSRNRTHLAFYLGKIDGELSFDLGEKVYSMEDIRIREPRFVIPTKGHLQSMIDIHDFSEGDPNAEFYPLYELKWKEVDGSLRLDTQGILPQLPEVLNQLGILPTRIYVGNEVEDYFTSKKIHGPGKESSLYSYMSAAKALNLDVPSALQQKVERMIAAEKEEIIKYVIEAYTEELTKERVSVPIRVFERAFELGMHQEPKTVTLKGGAILDLPKYISTFCSEHGIKLPEDKDSSLT